MKRGGGVPADAQSVRLCCESTDAVYGDQVALLYRHALLASLVTIVNAVLLTAVHWSHCSHRYSAGLAVGDGSCQRAAFEARPTLPP